MMIKKMRGSQRNSLTMWKRQILVERRSPATEGFAFIDAHQTFAARSGSGGLSKASPEANWDSRQALDDTERVHRVPFLFVGGRKKPFDNQMFVDDFRPRKRALHPCATFLSFAFSAQIAYVLSITEPVARHVPAKEPKREFKVGDKIRVNRVKATLVLVTRQRAIRWRGRITNRPSTITWLAACRWRIPKIRRQSAFGISLD